MIRKFLIAVQFLTVLPVKVAGTLNQGDFRFLGVFFPLVGFLIGVILSGGALVLGFLPSMVLAVVMLGLSSALTGALHLDGLADTLDGFYGGKSKEHSLLIMRDSRIGTYGAVGICIILILKFSLLAGYSREMLLKMLILAPMFSRWVQSLALAVCSYARTDGKAEWFFAAAQGCDPAIGALFSVGITGLLLGWMGVLVFGMALLPVLLFMRLSEFRIGGMTGDTVGAASEIAEVSFLLCSLGVLR